MPSFPDYAPTISNLLKRGLEEFDDREILVLDDRRETYRSLERASALLARGLLVAGVGKGTRVGILFPNGPDWATAFFAVTRIGAIAVLLNTFQKPRELLWTLKHADVDTLLLCDRFRTNDYLDRLEEAIPGLAEHPGGALMLPSAPHLRRVFVWGECDRDWARRAGELKELANSHPRLDHAFLEEVESTVTPSDPLLIVYTSGSTADPKGVVHAHGPLVRHAYHMAKARDLQPDDRIWTPMPLFWIGGVCFGMLAAMHVGACTVLEEYFEAGKTLEVLERERVTLSIGWPHYVKAMQEHPNFAKWDLSSMRNDTFRPDAQPRDAELRATPLGMTETCGPHTWADISVELPEELRGSFGIPFEGVEHKIVDPETGAGLPPGEHGEICVRGYSLMQGLYKRERQEVFDPDGFYHTGDGGFFRHGHLFFTGRLGEMIKTGGANVAPLEIEAVLLEFPEILEAYVLGLPDPVRGQNVALAVVLRPGHELSAEELGSRLKSHLSAYKLPRHITFFAEGSLPYTATGKIDKPRLTTILVQDLAEGAQ